MNKITIFTDGACHPKTKSGSWSAVICRGDEQQIITGEVENTTSNQMELTAVIQALSAVDLTEGEIEIFSDSQYVVCGVNEWLANWIRCGWMTSTGKPVANRDLWEQLHSLLECHHVIVSWVPRAENIAHGAKSVD